MDSVSIFDLGPSEKLQPWKICGTTLRPSRRPCQSAIGKGELARRKASLLKNPASGLLWEEMKSRWDLPLMASRLSAPFKTKPQSSATELVSACALGIHDCGTV